MIRFTTLVTVCLLVAAGSSDTLAQVTPEEHAQHHPESAAGDTNEASGAGGMQGMGDMGEMMSRMGVPPPKDIYPSLMDLPNMTAEQRDAFERLGHERMRAGTELMSEGFDALLRSSPTQDFEAMQDAVNTLREGLSRFDSGLAAHRVMNSGVPSDQAAMEWFKRELNLSTPASASTTTGPFGWSWFHASGMAVLIGFALVMIALYFMKMRRATNLLQELAAQPEGAPSAQSAPSASSAAILAPPPSPATAALQPSVRNERWEGRLRLAATFRETPDINTFRFVNPTGDAVPFSYLPGQFMTVEIETEGRRVKRSYTIASSPTRQEYVEIAVKREEHGVVSRALHDTLADGDELTLSAPSGTFTFTGEGEESIVLVSGGVGITPMMSVIRYLTDRAWAGHIYLLHCCRTTDDFCFRDELEYLQRKHPRLNITATMTRVRGSTWVGPTGRLSAGLIRECVPDIASKLVHLCGPPPMMEALKGTLCELGVPSERVKTEAFGPAKRAVPAADTATQASYSTVCFTVSGKTVPLPPTSTVLEAADDAGVDIDNSCRAGTCGSCKVKLLKGEVTMDVEDALDDADRQAGVILACQAKSKSDKLEVEA